MSYRFEWDPVKARSNLREHAVTIDEASTVFGDPLSLLMPDPDHSQGEERYLVLGMSLHRRLLVVSHLERPPLTRLISARRRPGRRGGDMSKARPDTPPSDEDTMRPEYDFSEAKRGVTARRYAEGANVVVVSPEVLDVFPDGAAVNEALQALAPLLRHR